MYIYGPYARTHFLLPKMRTNGIWFLCYVHLFHVGAQCAGIICAVYIVHNERLTCTNNKLSANLKLFKTNLILLHREQTWCELEITMHGANFWDITLKLYFHIFKVHFLIKYINTNFLSGQQNPHTFWLRVY